MNKICIFSAIAVTIAGLVAFTKVDECEFSERKNKAEEKLQKKKLTDTNKELVASIERAEEIAQEYKDYLLVPQMPDQFVEVIRYRQKILEMDLAVQRVSTEIKQDELCYNPETGYTYNLIKRYKKIYQFAKNLIDFINDDIIYSELGYDISDEDDEEVEPYTINVPKINYVDVDDTDIDDETETRKKKKKKKSSKKKDKKKSKKKKSSNKQQIEESEYYDEEDDFDPYNTSVDELEDYLEFDVHEKIPDVIAGKSLPMWGYVDRKRDEPDIYQMNELEEFNDITDSFFEELSENEELFDMFASKVQSVTDTIRKLITLKVLYVLIDDRVDQLIKKYMDKLTTIRANARYDRKVVY